MNCRYFVAAALVVAAAAPVSAQSVKAGIEAWQNSDYSGAVAIWRPLAEKGDADAEFNLGQAYRLGRGVPINLAAAKIWFERAANQGHVDAETTLGLLLFQNGDQAEGLKWLKKAADEDEPRALLVYGTALVNGDSVTQNPALGYAYVSRAAAQGLAPARETLKQLDEILPAEARKRALALGRELAKSGRTEQSVSTKAAHKPLQTAAKVTSTKPAPGGMPSQQAHADAIGGSASPAKAQINSSKTISNVTAAARASGSGWRIQLGAFSEAANAQSLFSKLTKSGAISGLNPFYVPAGAFTRLQVGPFESKTAAEAACRRVGVSCFPVHEK